VKVFWSWQSDRPSKQCRDVTENALKRALESLSDELELDPSERPTLDHDTKDEAGMVEIAATIFRKITQAGVFVGDITSAGRSEGGRELPNPNVLIELGWAWAHLSDQKIILVANKAYGPKKPEQLPFDIRHRRAVIFYSVPKSADAAAIEEATEGLSKDLREAIRASLSDWLTASVNDPGPVGILSRTDDPSVWFGAGTLLQHQLYYGGGLRDVRPEEGRRIYVRIIPERYNKGLPDASTVHNWPAQNGTSGLHPLGPWTNIDGGLNEDGVLRYALSEHSNPADTWTAAQWFRETGELWTFDSKRLRDSSLFLLTLARDVARFLNDGFTMLNSLGASRKMRVEVGAVGLKGSTWVNKLNQPCGIAFQDRVSVSQCRRTWDENAVVNLAVAFTAAFGEAYGETGLDAGTIKRMLSIK
jgi:hypothetical protein